MKALVDSNVIIAFLDQQHQHHDASRAVLRTWDGAKLVAAHSLAEVYNVLTRGVATAAFTPSAVVAALREVVRRADVHALTAGEMVDALNRFAQLGGRGPRLYDYLIGSVALVHHASHVVTWNVRDMAPLFPTLAVVTPIQFTGAI